MENCQYCQYVHNEVVTAELVYLGGVDPVWLCPVHKKEFDTPEIKSSNFPTMVMALVVLLLLLSMVGG